MSTMGASQQYHSEMQSGDIGSMDIISIIHPHLSEMPPTFIPAIASNPHPPPVMPSQLMQESSPVFTDMVDSSNSMAPSMHAPMLEISSAFMNSMEPIVAAPHLRAAPPGFLSDLPAGEPFPMAPPMEDSMNLEMLASAHSLSVSPPQSQVPSPSIHGTASSYSVGVTSSLESALDQPGVSIMRSRANTSVSPTTIPSSFITISPPTQQAVDMSFPPVEGVVGKQEEASPPDVDFQVVDMLSDIIQTTTSVMDSYMAQHNVEAKSKLHELEERVSQVTQMFKVMMPARAPTQSPSYSPPLPPPTVPAIEAQQQPVGFPPSAMDFSPISMDVSEEHLNVSDQSRKRCASELEEHRTVKAPKREPQDDVLLTLPSTEEPQDIDASVFSQTSVPLSLVSTHPLPHTQSRPSSRPPTPPVKFSSRGSFSSIKQASISSVYSSFAPNNSTIDFGTALPTAVPSTSPTFPGIHTSWSDPVVPSRHHHSLSAGSLAGSLIPVTAGSSAVIGGMMESFSTPPLQQVPLPPLPTSHTAATTISPPIGRMSRSGSINGTFPNSYGFGYIEPFSEPAGPWSSGIGRVSGKISSSHTTQPWFVGSEGSVPSAPPSVASDVAPNKSLSTAPNTTRNSPTEDDDDDDDDDSDNDSSFSKSANHLSADSPVGTPNTGSDVPQEYRAEVDRIFFEYLNKVCSNLDATDSKGEPIHQTLMAKKMQRLDESPDFRPFKFRIQAFTLAFLDELAAQGYPEEKIPMKKIRNYLWRQQYILRFNEDGKKAKSKGNHIWNIEAKKAGDGKWEFRPFYRKLAGSPPTVAYCGLKWSWTPRVWDPQSSWQNVPVEYSSPSLPSWLSWKDDVLSGIPPPDAESCRITTNAKYTLDGQEGLLTHGFNLTIAPMTSIDTNSFARSRRPSLAGDLPRRSTSDSVLFQAVQRAKPRPQSVDVESPDTRVIRVLQSVAQRVTEEAASQFVSASPPKQSDFQDLVKQKHVLEQTVEAYDKAISGNNPVQSRRLAVAAQNVVVQAAHTVIADRTVASGGIPIQQSETSAIKSVTVTELSAATQDAIAQAVKREGTASTEVDIIVAATSILKSRTPGSPAASADPTQTIIPQPRSHSTSAVPRLLPSMNSYPNLPPLSEYV